MSFENVMCFGGVDGKFFSKIMAIFFLNSAQYKNSLRINKQMNTCIHTNDY